MKRSGFTLAFLVTVAALAPGAVSAALPAGGTLTIRHATRGCHDWSLDGGPFKVAQKLQLARGGTLVITNKDLMVQDLKKTSGPSVKLKLIPHAHMKSVGMPTGMMGNASPYALNHMGAQLRVTFPTAGAYRFDLIDRGDYFDGIKTVGPDNKPTLTVVVR